MSRAVFVFELFNKNAIFTRNFLIIFPFQPEKSFMSLNILLKNFYTTLFNILYEYSNAYKA